MKKSRKQMLIYGVGSLLLLLALLTAALLFFTGDWFLLNKVLPAVGRQLELELSAEKVSYSWRHNRLTVTRLRGGSETDACFRIGELSFKPDFREILKGMLGCTDFYVRRLELVLYRQPNGDMTLYPSGKHISFENVPEIRIKRLSAEDCSFAIQSNLPGGGKVMEFSRFHGGAETFANRAPLQMKFSGFLQVGTFQNETVRSGDCDVSLNLLLDKEFELQHLESGVSISKLHGHFGGEPVSELDVKSDLAVSFLPQGEIVLERCRIESRDCRKLRSLIDLSGRVFPDSSGFTCEVREGRIMPEMTALFCETFFDFEPGSCRIDFKGSAGWRKDALLMLRGDLAVNRSGAVSYGKKQIPLPDHELKLSTNFMIDWQKGCAEIRHGEMTLKEAGRLLLSSSLVKPVQCALDAADGRYSSAAFRYRLNDFDLRQAARGLPGKTTFFPDGRLTMEGELRVGNSVSGLQLSGKGGIAGLQCRMPSGAIPVDRAEGSLLCRISRNGDFALSEVSANFFQGEALRGSFLYGERAGSIPGELYFSTRMECDALRKLMPSGSAADRLLEPAGPLKTDVQISGRRQGPLFSVTSCKIVHTGEEKDQFSVVADPFQINLSEFSPKSDLFFYGTGNVSSSFLRRYISRSRIYPEGGQLLWRAEGCVSTNWRNIRCRGRAELRDTKLHLWNLTLPECTAEPRFELLFRNLNQVEVSEFQLVLRKTDGKRLLSFSGEPCRWSLSPETFSGGGKVQELDAELLNAAFPGVFDRARVSGSVKAAIEDGVLNAALDLSLKEGVTRRSQQPLAGALGFSVFQKEGELQIRDFRFSLSDGKGAPWAELQGGFRRGVQSFQLDLVSPKLDLEKWLAILPENQTPAPAPGTAKGGVSSAKPSAAQTPAVPQNIPALPHQRSGVVTIRCSKLSYGPEISGSFAAEFLLDPGKIRSKNLQLELNNGKMTGELTAHNEEKGIRVRQKFTLTAPLELPPIAQKITGNAEHLPQGVLKKFSGYFELLDGGSWEKTVRTVCGTAEADVESLTFQSGLNHTTGVSILLYPVDIFSHVASLLPEAFGKWRKDLIQSARFSDSVTTVHFQRGTASCEIRDGIITLKNGDFSGDDQIVRHLQMAGKAGLYGDAPLELKAYVSGTAGQLTIPITGKVSDPKVDFSDIATASAGDFMQKVRDLNLIGEVSASSDKPDPLLVVDHLPTAGFWKASGRFFRSIFGGSDAEPGIH